jgi:hypothetical protein
VSQRIEKLRAALIARAPAGFRVTAKRTQYAMDEDTEAYCDIAVSGGAGDDEFRLVVVGAREGRVEQLMRNVWLRYAREIWFVGDGETRRATPETPDPATVADLDAALDGLFR